ncbi:response regulator transcription factor [Nesterenkonia rhizosphaerae]|uniref:Response regulator transcription factor n=1 Tax=Nesterenkonia rhizosphaerae TaxID=1348272 RepID=A0ABP9FXE2_9MICC
MTQSADTGNIRLLLADDQDLVRGGLSALLSLEPDLQVVAQVGRGDQVLAAVQDHRPDVALVDIEMPGIDGITAVQRIQEAGLSCRCLIVTTFGRPGYLRRAMDAGAYGFVVKDTPAEQLAQMVRRVAAGQRVVDPVLAAESLAGSTNPLTLREQEVLRSAAGGGSVKEIAAAVHLSQGTVRNHLSAIIGKLNARNRHDAARQAAENGWI